MSAGTRAFESRFGWVYLGISLLAAAAVVTVGSGAYLRSEASAVAVAIAIVAGAGLMLAVGSWLPGLIFTLVPVVCVFNTRRGFFPFDLVVLGLTTYALLDALWRKDLRLPGPRALHVAFLTFIVSGMITVFLAREFSSFGGSMKRLIVGYFGATLVLRHADRERWPWFALSIPVVGTAIAVQVFRSFSIRGFVVQKALELRTYYSDVGWGGSNYVGAVLALAILGSFILLVLPGRPWLRLVSGVALMPMGVCMALLVSRGTIVAVGVGMLAMLATLGGQHRWKILALSGVGGALFTQLPVFKVILLRFTAASQSMSVIARVVHWRFALDRFLEHPLLGVGLGQGKFQADELLNNDPHNYFLSVASEMGVVGVLAWVGLLAAFFRTAWVASRGDPLRSGWVNALGVFMGIAVFYSCYEPTFPGTHYFFLFFWIAAILHRAADGAAMASPAQALPR